MRVRVTLKTSQSRAPGERFWWLKGKAAPIKIQGVDARQHGRETADLAKVGAAPTDASRSNVPMVQQIGHGFPKAEIQARLLVGIPFWLQLVP